MGVCVHGLCLETVHELAKSADSNLDAVHVKHLVRPANNQTSLLEAMFLLCRVKSSYWKSENKILQNLKNHLNSNV